MNNLIEQQYRGRPYHNLEHLSQVRAALSEFIEIDEALDAAIDFHDLIYVVGSTTNEFDSAVLAVKFFPAQEDFLFKAILATKNHKATGDHRIDLFLDADMSILGMLEDHYDRYRAGVRVEYGMYGDAVFNAGRLDFLRSFKGFITDEFNTKYLAQAKENIAREIKELECLL